MDYLDEIEQQRTAASQAPPPLAGLPTGQVSGMSLQYATPQAMSPVRAVGLAQRRIMWVILASILLMFSFMGGSIIMPSSGVATIGVLALVLVARLAIIVLMMIGVYQMAAALGAGMTARVLYVLAMLIPLIGLIVLLVVNQQATSLLRRNRIRVGLMGPRVSDLPAV